MSTATNNRPTNELATAQSQAPAKADKPTPSEQFLAHVQKNVAAQLNNPMAFSDLQKTLTQHLFVKIDSALRAAEIKRLGNTKKANDPAVTWANVNMLDLSLRAVHIVNLELDAAVPNHVHVVAYLNSRTRQYDVDLRIGYSGVDHVARKFAIEPPLDIVYKLVHETDTFDYGITGEGIHYYDYKQSSPFNPGRVIGGFGYISYENPRKNRVVIVEFREFEKARRASQGVEFWGGEKTKWVNNKPSGTETVEGFEKEMQYKTVVHRVCKHIPLDPRRINGETLIAMSGQLDSIDAEFAEEVAENANTQTVALEPRNPVAEIPVTAESVTPEPVPVTAQPSLAGDEDDPY